MPRGKLDLWKDVEVVVEGIGRRDEAGNGKADPQARAFEKRRQPTLVTLAHHVERQLCERIDELFALDPLAAEDDGDADHGEIDGDNQDAPSEQGEQPSVPGNGRARGQALVEMLDGARVVGDQEVADVGVEQVVPAIFWRGEVEPGPHDRQEVFREAAGGNRRGDEHHAVDQ